jgi:hypothetical protein
MGRTLYHDVRDMARGRTVVPSDEDDDSGGDAECATCGATTGEPCTDENGQPREPHRARLAASRS